MKRTFEIGTGKGTDWTLTWDEEETGETVALIDFGSVLGTTWPSLAVMTNPPDGAVGVDPGTSVDWIWPPSPTVATDVDAILLRGDPDVVYPGEFVEVCSSGEFPQLHGSLLLRA